MPFQQEVKDGDGDELEVEEEAEEAEEEVELLFRMEVCNYYYTNNKDTTNQTHILP